jgi:hypothetical protein
VNPLQSRDIQGRNDSAVPVRSRKANVAGNPREPDLWGSSESEVKPTSQVPGQKSNVLQSSDSDGFSL